MPETMEISEAYAHCVDAWGEASLPPLSEIRVTLEEAMTRSMGRAHNKCFRRRNGHIVRRDYYSITLSAPLLGAIVSTHGAPVAKMRLRELEVHELAHISLFFRYPGVNMGHGRTWCELMWKAGYDANRFYGTDDDDDLEIDWSTVIKIARNSR